MFSSHPSLSLKWKRYSLQKTINFQKTPISSMDLVLEVINSKRIKIFEGLKSGVDLN